MQLRAQEEITSHDWPVCRLNTMSAIGLLTSPPAGSRKATTATSQKGVFASCWDARYWSLCQYNCELIETSVQLHALVNIVMVITFVRKMCCGPSNWKVNLLVVHRSRISCACRTILLGILPRRSCVERTAIRQSRWTELRTVSDHLQHLALCPFEIALNFFCSSHAVRKIGPSLRKSGSSLCL